MPGITGIISKTQLDKNKVDLNMMINCMKHENYFTSGSYVNNQLGINIGWVLHKGSFSDCLPIWNEKRDLALFFSGENFVNKETINHLRSRGHKFNDSNASCLIHFYEENESEFFQQLNGWFNGVLIDLRKSKVILFNDRYGMQRLYYYEDKEAFLFSSEAKSLLNVRPELRKFDMKSLGEFFSCSCVLENRSLFTNVSVLPGGAAWTFENGSTLKKQFYFTPSTLEDQPILDESIFYNKLRETFRQILPKYFQGEKDIAMSMTGGLDTRMIMANIDLQPGVLPCYTFGGIFRDSFDVKIASKIAHKCEQPFQVIPLDNKFLLDFSKYAEKTVYISDGNLDISGSPEIYVNNIAREIAPIRLTGNHGSEVLRSMKNLKWSLSNEGLYNADFIKYIHDARNTLLSSSNGHPLTFTVFKETPWLEYNRLACEQSQLTLRSPYMDNELVALMYQAPASARKSVELSSRLIHDGNYTLDKITTDRGIKGDASFFSTFLRKLYYESLFKAEYLFNYGMPQNLAYIDYMLKSFHLERMFLGHHKFYHFRVWYRDELAEYVKEILLDKRTMNRGYLKENLIEKLVIGHTKGYKNYTTEISRLISTELIHRHILDTP